MRRCRGRDLWARGSQRPSQAGPGLFSARHGQHGAAGQGALLGGGIALGTRGRPVTTTAKELRGQVLGQESARIAGCPGGRGITRLTWHSARLLAYSRVPCPAHPISAVPGASEGGSPLTSHDHQSHLRGCLTWSKQDKGQQDSWVHFPTPWLPPLSASVSPSMR